MSRKRRGDSVRIRHYFGRRQAVEFAVDMLALTWKPLALILAIRWHAPQYAWGWIMQRIST